MRNKLLFATFCWKVDESSRKFLSAQLNDFIFLSFILGQEFLLSNVILITGEVEWLSQVTVDGKLCRYSFDSCHPPLFLPLTLLKIHSGFFGPHDSTLKTD